MNKKWIWDSRPWTWTEQDGYSVPVADSARSEARNQQQHIQAAAKMLLFASDCTSDWNGAAVESEFFIADVL